MTRYVRQIRTNSCGPTAIINCVKWAGYRCTIREYHTLISELCECSKDGAPVKRFGLILRMMMGDEFSVWYRRGPTLDVVIKHLRKPNRSIVLAYYYPDVVDGQVVQISGHYTFVFIDDAGIIRCVNDTGKTVDVLKRSELRARLERRSLFDVDAKADVWFVRKR